jgi:hypothetical protein
MTPEPTPESTEPVRGLIMSTGITVTALKRLLESWPEEDEAGRPTEVWLSTGVGITNPCVEIWPLNRAATDGGTPTADILLEPSDEVWGPRD